MSRWNIRHLEGRYDYDPGSNRIWGYMEKEWIPVVDGKIHVTVHHGGQAASVYGKYSDGTRGRLAIPIDALFAWNGSEYINIAPLLSGGHIVGATPHSEGFSGDGTDGGER